MEVAIVLVFSFLPWALGIKLRSSSLRGKSFSLLSHLSSATCFVAQSISCPCTNKDNGNPDQWMTHSTCVLRSLGLQYGLDLMRVGCGNLQLVTILAPTFVFTAAFALCVVAAAWRKGVRNSFSPVELIHCLWIVSLLS